MFLKNTNKSLLKKTHRPLPEIISKSDIHKNIENKELNGTVGIKDNIPSFSISRTNVDIELKTINYVNGTILEYSGNTSQLHSYENKASKCISLSLEMADLIKVSSLEFNLRNVKHTFLLKYRAGE